MSIICVHLKGNKFTSNPHQIHSAIHGRIDRTIHKWIHTIVNQIHVQFTHQYANVFTHTFLIKAGLISQNSADSYNWIWRFKFKIHNKSIANSFAKTTKSDLLSSTYSLCCASLVAFVIKRSSLSLNHEFVMEYIAIHGPSLQAD